MRHPENEATLEETYDELEQELQKKIEGITHQIKLLSDKRNAIIQVNRTAKTAMDVFKDILKKEHLERNDLELIIEKIKVFENHLEVALQPDIDSLLQCHAMEDVVNFKVGTENSENTLIQSAKNHADKVFRVHVINEGDPLEIFTDSDGLVVFKKYSPIGELSDFAGQYAEVLNKAAGLPALICDCDHVVAAAGVPRKEYLGRRITADIEEYMQSRAKFFSGEDHKEVYPVEGMEQLAGVICPIISSSDVTGAVVLLKENRSTHPGETEEKLAQATAAFLGKQLET